VLKKLQTFFENNFLPDNSPEEPIEHKLNLAAAALLVEMTLQDCHADEIEVGMVKQSLVDHLGLTYDEADELYALAETEKHQATDYHQFTQLISQHYTQPQKVTLVEALWHVAFADSVLDKYEEQMVRKICDLIHVSHKDYLQAKHRVQQAIGA